MRSNLDLPCFFFPRAAARAPETCASCPNRSVCAGVRRPTVEAIRAAGAVLGLDPTDVRFVDAHVEIDVDEPAARADEVFLSEKLSVEVRLSSIARALKRETIRLSEEVFRRWERVRFYPVEELRKVGRRMASSISD